jgi:hypothetical protein
MKQTAVEWLVENIREKGLVAALWNEKVFERAKEMEKQQIIDANRNGVDMVIDNKQFITGEQYYNKTFNKGQ